MGQRSLWRNVVVVSALITLLALVVLYIGGAHQMGSVLVPLLFFPLLIGIGAQRKMAQGRKSR